MFSFFKKYLVKYKFHILIFFVVLLFLSWNILEKSRTRYFHVDEVINLERTKFFDWYRLGDFSDEHWQVEESYDQPKFSELFFGFLMNAIYKTDAITKLSNDEFYRKTELYSNPVIENDVYKYCCELERLPKDTLSKIESILDLRKALIFIFVIPSLVLIFLIGIKAKNYLFGIFSMIIIGSNNLFVSSQTTMMGESQLWFFSLLFLYFSLFYFEKTFNNKKTEVLSLTLGLISGIAISVKLNAIILLVFFAILNIYLYFFREKSHSYIRNILILFVTSFIVFFIINPFLWKQPINGVMKMANHRLNLLTTQVDDAYVMKSFKDRLTNVFDKILLKNENFSSFDNYFFSESKLSVDLLIIIVGIIVPFIKFRRSKIRNVVKRIKKFKINKTIHILGLYLVVLFVMTTFFIKIDWDRYYFPYILLIGFIHAYIFSFFFENIYLKIFKR